MSHRPWHGDWVEIQGAASEGSCHISTPKGSPWWPPALSPSLPLQGLPLSDVLYRPPLCPPPPQSTPTP